MLIVLHPDITPQAQAVVEGRVRELGFTPHAIPGASRTAIGITGNKGAVDPDAFDVLPGVADAVRVTQPYKLVSPRGEARGHASSTWAACRSAAASSASWPAPARWRARSRSCDGATAVAARGRDAAARRRVQAAHQPLRRSRASSEEGLELLAEARARRPACTVVTEVMDTETLPTVAEYADMLQIGARNMQNFSLLEARRASCASRCCSSAACPPPSRSC